MPSAAVRSPRTAATPLPDADVPWEQLLGPLGLLAGALIAVGVLWRIVLEYIKELKRQRDESHILHTSALSRLDRLTDAVERLTGTVDRIDARRTENIEEVAQRIVKALKP